MGQIVPLNSVSDCCNTCRVSVDREGLAPCDANKYFKKRKIALRGAIALYNRTANYFRRIATLKSLLNKYLGNNLLHYCLSSSLLKNIKVHSFSGYSSIPTVYAVHRAPCSIQLEMHSYTRFINIFINIQNYALSHVYCTQQYVPVCTLHSLIRCPVVSTSQRQLT